MPDIFFLEWIGGDFGHGHPLATPLHTAASPLDPTGGCLPDSLTCPRLTKSRPSFRKYLRSAPEIRDNFYFTVIIGFKNYLYFKLVALIVLQSSRKSAVGTVILLAYLLAFGVVFAGGDGGRHVLVTEFRGMALNGIFYADVLRSLDLVPSPPLTDLTYKYHPLPSCFEDP